MSQPLWLRIEGARQNNLKNVSVTIPHDRVTVITGVSGSGKSSLAFDTLFAEGQWRYIESLPTYATEARSDSAEQVADGLVRDHPGARALVCFPLSAAPGGDFAARFAALLQRGFARVKIGEVVLDLADAAGRPAALPPERAGLPVSVVLDRVVIG